MYVQLFGLESSLRELERKHNVSSRWSSSSPEFLEVVSEAAMSAKQKLQMKLLSIAKERIFYLNTMAHHAGIFWK